MTSLRKLAGLVGLLVLCTGFAVGLYVEALNENPVEAGFEPSSRLGGPWVHRVDDVRVPSRRLHLKREQRGGRADSGEARPMGLGTSGSGVPSRCGIERVLGAFETSTAGCPATAVDPEPAG